MLVIRARFLAPLAALALALVSAPAAAATWGSFSSARIAYATGPLDGDVHSELRALIDEHGDTLAPPTAELTAEYLATVDVFYTSMLSDGTGPTAGAAGTLSLPEQAALHDFVAAGGTLVVTPDSNGFDGPFPTVYDSWLADYDVTDFAFVFGPDTGSTLIVHPITEGVDAFDLDGTVTFSHMASAQVLATTTSAEPLMAVLEPATGFIAGGRVLVLADHNVLTDAALASAGNETLARNIVGWAAGECGNEIVEASEECDDGNLSDGDGCDAACVLEAGGSSGGQDDTAGSSGAPPTDDTGPAPGSSGAVDATTTAPGDGSTDDGAPIDSAGDGCGCRSEGGSSGSLVGLGLVLLVASRRRRLSRA